MPLDLSKQKNLPAYGISGCVVFVYVLVRSMKLDITYDEAMTLTDFVPQTPLEILNFKIADANNHILNSLAIKLLFSILPNTVFVARIPNIIGLVVFLYYSYSLCARFLSGYTGIIAFLLLTLNPFCLDFFGLARGYGLALACELGSLYYAVSYLRDCRSRHLAFSFSWGAFAVIAALSNLNFYLGLAGLLGIHLLFVNHGNKLKNLGVSLAITLALTLIIWEPVRKLIESDSLYYGGDLGFYQDTLLTLGRYSMYSLEDSAFLNGLTNIFLLIFLMCVAIPLFRTKTVPRYHLFLLLVLSLSAFATIVQHYLLGGKYLVDRTALFFYPLFVLTLCFSIDHFTNPNLKTSVLVFFATTFIANFLVHANLIKTVTWYFDSHTTEMLNAIKRESSNRAGKAKLDYSWPLESSLKYYLKQEDYNSIESVKHDYFAVDSTYEYYLYLGGTLDRIRYEPENQPIVKYRKDTVLAFPAERVYLFRKSR